MGICTEIVVSLKVLIFVMLGGDGDVQRRYLDFPWITLTLLGTSAPVSKGLVLPY